MTEPTTSVENSVLGEKVIGLKGKRKAQAGGPRFTMILYVKAQGVPLPCGGNGDRQGATEVLSLGHWSERVAVRTPNAATGSRRHGSDGQRWLVSAGAAATQHKTASVYVFGLAPRPR